MSKYGVYLISDPKYGIDKIEDALKTGKVKYLQYRNKDASDEAFTSEAIQYKQLCEKYGTKLIVNDRVHIAQKIGADGIHVGQDDLSVCECKKLYPDLIVGVSVRTVEEAEQATIDKADYIGVGAMFATKTKLDATQVSLETLSYIYNNFDIDIVTIGGITVDNAHKLIPYSDGLAICSNILGAKSPASVVLEYAKLIS